MASFEGESLKVVEKFRGDNFHVWKAKMELQLSALDLWDIVDESEEAPGLEASFIKRIETKLHTSKSRPARLHIKSMSVA
jgi:hypothetical protein